MQQRVCWILFLGVALNGAACGWFGGEEPEAEEKEDTGYTVEQREELMRTIGYVQQ
ncbi:MAG: hypothetical protein VXW32_14710 [Myxococcota bacterium]|jgi:hypothetical protein|nr:hypothetical protein [Myxococcota bacterium]